MAFIRLLCILTVLGFIGASHAGELYTTQIITSGASLDRRPAAFALCLEQGLIKVSGDATIAGDPRLQDIQAHAADHIAAFEYRDRYSGRPLNDEQGSYDRPHDLTCRFDPAKLDAAIVKLGRKAWHEPRPELLIELSVTGPDGQTSPLTNPSANPQLADMATSLLSTAEKAGVELILPPSARYSPEQLEGRLVWNADSYGWKGEWSLQHDGKTIAWSIGRASFDDAFRHAIGGAAQVLSGNGMPASLQ